MLDASNVTQCREQLRIARLELRLGARHMRALVRGAAEEIARHAELMCEAIEEVTQASDALDALEAEG